MIVYNIKYVNDLTYTETMSVEILYLIQIG